MRTSVAMMDTPPRPFVMVHSSAPGPSGKIWDDVSRQQVDLPGVVGHGAEHEVFETGPHEVGDPRLDPVDASDHVALLEMRVGTVGSHDSEERFPRRFDRLGVVLGLDEMDEVA